jgi:hypothetical protein
LLNFLKKTHFPSFECEYVLQFCFFITIDNYFSTLKMCKNYLQHKGQVWIAHLCMFAKDFQHEYQRELCMSLHNLSKKKIKVVLILLIMHWHVFLYLQKEIFVMC